ncbi:MAG TPA: hypothetical protein VK870_16870 [Ignavibacteriaceae bacterium]|nr:hypothetical protein [Ignavibacteriaceae bacterium]
MKNQLLLSLLIMLLFSICISAQSDYEIVQSFKSKVQQLEQQLSEAASLDELNNIAKDIELLKDQFSESKELLDKSLYPEDFNKTFAKLKSGVEVRALDFTQIEVLQTEVIVLRDEVDRLNTRNRELINQIAVLQADKNKDVETIRKLESLVTNLKASLFKRDNLILGIVDSLTPQLTADVSSLSPEDKQKIAAQFESNSVLNNVKRSLRDHVRFLDVTTLKPDDIKEIKKQQDYFVSTWQKIGVNLVDVYADKIEKSNELKEIDLLFANWQTAIRNEAWNSIKEEFAVNNIFMQDFKSGQEFTVELTRFIDEEFKNYGIKSKEDSERIYASFVDSTWFKYVQPEWIPYLIDNKMLTAQQKSLIEAKVTEWKNVVFPRDITWVYYVIAALLLVTFLYFLLKRKSKTLNAKEELKQ